MITPKVLAGNKGGGWCHSLLQSLHGQVDLLLQEGGLRQEGQHGLLVLLQQHPCTRGGTPDILFFIVISVHTVIHAASNQDLFKQFTLHHSTSWHMCVVIAFLYTQLYANCQKSLVGLILQGIYWGIVTRIALIVYQWFFVFGQCCKYPPAQIAVPPENPRMQTPRHHL